MPSQMTRFRSTATAATLTTLLLLLLALTGCASLPGGQLPEGTTARSLGNSLPGSPLAWSVDSRSLAVVDKGLEVVRLEDGLRSVLTAEIPSALAWSADGSRLAAAFPAGDESLLRLYGRDGRFTETRLAGQVENLFWPASGGLFAIAHRIQPYTFGVNVSASLYRWDGSDRLPAGQELFNATLKRGTRELMASRHWSLVKADLSPDGQQLLFGELHDPPVFPAYAQLVLRDLATAADRALQQVSLSSAGGRFANSARQLLIGDGETSTLLLDAGSGAEQGSWPWPGRSLAAAAQAPVLLVDGQLLRDGQEIGRLSAGAEGWLAPHGDQLLVRRADRLYLLSGF